MNLKFLKLSFICLLVILITIGYRFYDYVVDKNLILSIYTPCNPSTEECFITDEENAYFDFQLEPYKKVEIVDKYAPICLEEHNCENFVCDNIESCNITYCSEDTLEEWESCVEIDTDEIIENKKVILDQEIIE